MLRVEVDTDGLPVLTQTIKSPSVYVDQWAVMKMAEKGNEQFTNVVLRRHGTVLISWMNILEFSKVKNASTAEAVESLLNGLERHVAFIDPDPGAVEEREDVVACGAVMNASPALDNSRLLKIMSMNAKRTGALSFSSLLKIAQSHLDEQWRLFETSMANTSSILEEKRRQFLADPVYARRINNPPLCPPTAAPTRYVRSEILNGLIRDQRTPMGSSQWADYGHTVVASAYADFVLLDKGWVHRATEARRRVDPGGSNTHFASVFSEATLDAFWGAFDV